MMENKKIAELLRMRDLCLKKIEKESSKFVAYDVVVGNAKNPTEIGTAVSTFQSVYDLLSNACTITSVLRKANVATLTSLTDYWGKTLSVVECRQNTVGDKIIGLPSAHFHLKALYNKMLKQTSDVNTLVKNHNESHGVKLKKIQETEYLKHEEERKSSRDQNVELPVDFETVYETKLKNIAEAFWLKNKAVQVDPVNVFEILQNISSWTDNFEKNKEMLLNRANNSEPVTTFDLTPFVTLDQTTSDQTTSDQTTSDVSLEELSDLIKEKNKEISLLIDRLVIVSYKIGINTNPVNQLVETGHDNYNLIMDMIKSYGLMQEAFRIVSTFTLTNYVNPINKTKMSAVDMADFKNIVIPVMTKMLDIVENQKKSANIQVKTQEGTIRTDVIKLLEGSMNSASSRPTVDKIKEYTNNLMESVSSRVVFSSDIEKQLHNFQQVLDEFDSQIKPALATINANTRVKIVWNITNVPKITGSWDTLNLMTQYVQPEIVESSNVYDDFDNYVAENDSTNEWNEPSYSKPKNIAHSGGRGRGSKRGAKGRL